MASPQLQPFEVSRTAAPATPVAACSRGGALCCSTLGNRSCRRCDNRCPETGAGGIAGKKRRRAIAASSSESAASPAVDTAAAAAQRRVRNTQVKHFDPATRRFVFLSFAQQLQQKLQHHVAPLHRSGALDLLQQQQIWLRHSVGCAGIRRMKSAADDDSRRNIGRTSELDYSAFRAMVQEYKFARNPPRLASLLTELQCLSSTLPLLLLERQRIVQLLLRHIVCEECCTVVLALLQALAKDLRAELAPYLPSIFSTLLLVLQQLESEADAERLSLLFACVSNLFRYLAKPLLGDFRFALDLYLPWLCGAVAVGKRSSRCSETSDAAVEFGQAQEYQKSCERVSPQLADPDATASEELEAPPTSADVSATLESARRAVGSRAVSRKNHRLSKNASRLPEVQILAAQAFACLLRKAAADEDGGALLHCVHELMMCISRCSPRSSPILAEAFGRVLFETVRSFHHSLSSSFDRLLRFLLASVLFQKTYKDSVSGVEYSPTASCSHPESALTAGTVSEVDGSSGQPPLEEEVVLTRLRESKRRKRMSAGEHGVVPCRLDGDIADVEALFEEANCHTAEHAERSREQNCGRYDVAGDGRRIKSQTERFRGNVDEAANTLAASSADTEETSCLFPYFYQVKCLETLLKLVRLHAGSMQSKAAHEVQALLLEFLAAALKARSASTEDPVTPAGVPRFNEGTRERQATSNKCDLQVADGTVTAYTSGTALSSNSTCTSDVQCVVIGGSPSVPFVDFLHSSFLPYFYERPAPRSLSSHPYFRSCGTWLLASEPGTSCFLRPEAVTQTASSESLPSVSAVRLRLTTTARMKNSFFVGFGLLSLLEFVGDWAAAIPRLQGSFDDFAHRLLRVLAPYARPLNSTRGREVNSSKPANTPPTRRTTLSSTPPILRPLVDFLQCCPTLCSSGRCVLQRMEGRHSDAAWLRMYETSAVFAVILPCAFLRLIAVTWRAIPKSFAAAISTVAPDLLKDLLLSPEKLEQLSSACSQQAIPFAARRGQDQLQQHSMSGDDCHAAGCWRARLGDVYLDCCVAFISLLQHPELLLAEPETYPIRVRGFVDEYALHALRPAFDFLVWCFCDRRRDIVSSQPTQHLHSSVVGSFTDVAAEARRAHAVGDGERYVLSSSQWRRSASGVLLAEQLRTFWDTLRSGSTIWNTAACLRRGLNALTAAFDELLCWISDWNVTSVRTPLLSRRQHEEGQTEVLMYVWGLMTWAQPLLGCVSASCSSQSVSKSAIFGLLRAEFEEEQFWRAVQELQDRLLKFIFCAIVWIAKGLVGRSEYEYSQGAVSESTAGNVGKAAITRECHRRCRTDSGQNKRMTVPDESHTGAEQPYRKLSMICFQVLRQSVDCLSTLAAGHTFSKGEIPSLPFLNTRHIACIFQQLAYGGESQDGDGPQRDLSTSATDDEVEGLGKNTLLCAQNQATSDGQQIACSVLRMLLGGCTSSAVPPEKSEDSMQSTYFEGELALEKLSCSTGEHMQSDWGFFGEAPAAARWVVLLLSLFDATDCPSSSSTMKPFLLPLLQCCLDCLQAFTAEAHHAAIEAAQGVESRSQQGFRGVRETAAEAFLREAHGWPAESMLKAADSTQRPLGLRIVDQGMTLVTTAVRASLPVLLPCLSSPCRSLRLTVARLLLRCSVTPGQLVPVDASGCCSAMYPLRSGTLPGASGQVLVESDASLCISSCRDLFQDIVDLESTEICLNEERRLTRLVEKVGQSSLQLFQDGDGSSGNHLEHVRCRVSVESWQERRASSLLLGFECAVRVLVAQFSVRFTPLWQAAVDALYRLGQKAANPDQLGRGSSLSSTEEGDGLPEARSYDTPTAGICPDHWFSLLPMMWRIVVGEVRRAEDELNQLHTRADENDRRQSHVQEHQAQQQAEDHVYHDVKRSSSLSVESGFKRTADHGVDTSSAKASGVDCTSSSRALVLAAWRQGSSEIAGGQDLLENGIQEADALSRHTQLLRVVENINRITFSGVGGDDIMESFRSPKVPGDSKCPPLSIQQREDNLAEYKEGETCETEDASDESVTVFPGTELQCTSDNCTKICGLKQSPNLTMSTGTKQGNREDHLCMKKHVETLKRTQWTLSEALRLVGALTTDAAEGCAVAEVDDVQAEHTCRQKRRQNQEFAVSAHEVASSNTTRVSLIPRLCSVLRAVVALGTTRVTRRLRLSTKGTSTQWKRSSTGRLYPSKESFQAVSVESGFVSAVEDYLSLAEVVSDMWSRLLGCCAQRVITVADSTLQQLSVKVLQLCPTLRSRLQPYAPLLEQLIVNKGVSDILLRLRVKDTKQQGSELKMSEDQQADTAGDIGPDRHSGEGDVLNRDKANGAMEGGIVLLGEHKDTVLPLLVRLLLTKVQQRATKRSATTSFSQRRTILSFISSIAAEELPLVLAVLLHPLTCVRQLHGPLHCEGGKDCSGVGLGPTEKAERVHPPVTLDACSAPTSFTSRSVTDISILRSGYSSEAGIYCCPSPIPQRALSGFAKEEVLRNVVVECVTRQRSRVRKGKDGPPDQARQGNGATAARSSVSVPAAVETEQMKWANVESWNATREPAAVIVETELPQDGSLVAISLAPACLPPQSLTRLRGCLETLKQLQELVGQLLRPAAPFLMRFYCTLLQQLAAKRELSQAGCDVSRAATATVDCTNFINEPGKSSAVEAPLSAEASKAYSKSTYQKAVVHSVLLLLKQLLDLFPDDAATWQTLLRDATAPLQQLLEAAIATAAASPVYSGGPGKSGRHEKKSIPAVISLVASWAAHPAYYSFFTALLPHALTALFRVPATPAVLRAVCLRDRLVHGSKPPCGRSLGVLDAAIDVALQLSCGSPGETEEYGKRHGAKERTRNRRRRDYGSESSTSEAEDFTDEKNELLGEPAGASVQQQTTIWQREQQELLRAAQYQREGMNVLRPYLPGLLKSLEVLFQRRSAAIQSATGVSVSRSLPSKAISAGVCSPCDETIIGTRREGDSEKRCERDESNAIIVVRVKEMQLLTRIAQFTVDEHEELQQLDGTSGTDPAQGGDVSVGGAASVKPAEGSLACSLVRLLLQCLWGSSSRGGDAWHPGAAGDLRRLLTLQALRRLTLPLAARIRALREKTVCDARENQCGAERESDEPVPGEVSSASMLRAREGAGCSLDNGCVEGHAYMPDASVDVLRLTVKSCCRLLQESRSLQCRVATAELLLAAELAACGLSHSDELFNDVLGEINACLRRTGVGESVGFLTLDGDAAHAETNVGLRMGDGVVDALVPSGSIFKKFLQRAVTLSDEKVHGRDSDLMNETTCQIQKDLKTTPFSAKAIRDCGEPKEHDSHFEESHECIVASSPRVVSVLANSSMQARSVCFEDGSGRGSHNGEQQLHSKALNSNEEESVVGTQWRVAVGLILLCVNAGKSCGRRLPLHSTGEDEEVPDSDTQIIVLSSLAERCIDVQVPLDGRPRAPLETEESRRSEDHEAGPETYALQVFNQSTLAASAAEPLVRQCLYLLTSSVVEWSVQQVALNILKRLVDAVVAAAAHCSSTVNPDFNSLGGEATPAFSCFSVASCVTAVASATDGIGEKCSDDVVHRYRFTSVRQAIGRHASGIMNLLADLVMPAARLQLKRSHEEQWRVGVQLIEHVVRSFAPVVHCLAHLTASADCALSAAFACPAADTQRRITRLQQVFNLDLACLVLRTSAGPVEEHDPMRAAASGTLESIATARETVQAAVVAACSRNAGGDFFIDLLHVQRHRRGRALQRMSVAAEAGLLSRSTLQTVALPLCFGALLQRESCATKQQKQRSGRHRQLFHQGLCEQGVKCLEVCCARVPWKRCLRVIQVLAGFLVRIPEREVYIYRAICGAVRAFEKHAKVARAAAGVTQSHAAGLVDSDIKSDIEQCQHWRQAKQVADPLLLRCTSVPQVQATAVEASFVSSPEAAASLDPVDDVRQSGESQQKPGAFRAAEESCEELTGELEAMYRTRTGLAAAAADAKGESGLPVHARMVFRKAEEEEEKKGADRACHASGVEGSGRICERELLRLPTCVASASRLEKLQTCIRVELLPLLFRLSFPSRQMKASVSDGIDGFETCSGTRDVRERCNRVRQGDEGSKAMNPTLVVVCILLMRLLPPALFEEQLPRLVRLVALRLRSRNRDARRQARGALVSIASKLGTSFVPFLTRELDAIFRSTTAKGHKSQKDNEAASTGSQAFLSSVLLFTLHAIVHHVIRPHQAQSARASDPSKTAVKRGRGGTSSFDATVADPCGSAVELTDETGGAASEEITAGCIDEAFPVLLPLVAEELSRTCDSDRPFGTASKSDGQSTKNDEAKHLKGAALIYLLSSVCSRASCEELMVPFFNALLTGEQLVCTWSGGDEPRSVSHQQQRMIIRQRQGFSSTAAFSPAYLERIRELLFNFAKGLNLNTGLTVNFKLLLSRRLLVMAVSIMQQQCLHPLRQLCCRRKELLELALAQQQVEVHATRFANVYSQRWRTATGADGDRTQLPPVGQRSFDTEMEGAGSLDAGQVHLHSAGSTEVVRKRRGAKRVHWYDETVETEMRFFRNVFLLGSLSPREKDWGDGAVGAQAAYSSGGEKTNDSGYETRLLVELDSHSEAAHALRAAEFYRREDLRMAVATRKDRAMLTQPGAASGRSLEQAIAARRTAKGRGGGGFDDSSRAAAIGGTALRLLLLTLKKHKAELNEGVATRVQTNSTAKHLKQKNGMERRGNAPHVDIVAGDKAHRIESLCCAVELEKCVENVVCSLCSTDNELIAWSARCLIYMLGLRLHEVDRLGSVIAYCALRVFQVAGENESATQQKQQQVLLAPCTRLLALLLLRPQSSKWVDKALYGGRAVPRTQGEFLRQQMRKQAQHQLKAAAARKALPDAVFPKQKFSAEKQSLETLVDSRASSGHQGRDKQSTAASSAANDVGAPRRQSISSDCYGDDAYTQLQVQLLRVERDEPPMAAADANEQQVKFREALVAQIAHALENSHTRLSALVLFKSVVLPHYREVAASALKGNDVEDSRDNIAREPELQGSEYEGSVTQKKGTLAGCWLLKEVYRCVDVIARLMIQEAGDSGEIKRLAALCADVYVHFLLNFPMTAKAQQRKVLFLIKNLGYATVDGRRAVLNCIHKILCRFPYELTVEKYSDIMMVSLCGRLVLEEDPVTHSMLRMLVGQLMHISEDLQDGRHSSSSVLQTCAQVLLQPKVTNLLAVEELVLIFIDVQAARLERRLPHKILPLLHRTLVLSEAAHKAPTHVDTNLGAVAVCACVEHGCCDGVDWRVCYKALLIFEKLLLCTHPSELDRIFAKTALAVQQLSRPLQWMGVVSGNRDHERLRTSTNVPGLSARLVEVLYSCRPPAVGTAYRRKPIKGTMSVTDGTKNTVQAPEKTAEQESGDQTDADPLLEKTLTIDSPDTASAFALARVWLLTAGAGITHCHPWIRAVSLRCAGLYVGAKLYSGFNGNSPCLFYLPLGDMIGSVERDKCARRDSESIGGHFSTEQVNEQGDHRQESAYILKRRALANTTESDKKTGFSSNSGVTLLVGALKSLGEDDFLERSPHAVPAVYALLVPLLKLTIERPDFFGSTQGAEVEASRWNSGIERPATPLSTDNVNAVRMAADVDYNRSGVSSAEAGTGADVGCAFGFKAYEKPSEENPSPGGVEITTKGRKNEFVYEKERANGEVLPGKKAKRCQLSNEVQGPPASSTCEHHLGEALWHSDCVPATGVVFNAVQDYAATALPGGDDDGTGAIKILAYQEEDALESSCATEDAAASWTATLRTDHETLRTRGSQRTGAAAGNSPDVERKLFAFEEQAAAVATTKVCFGLQRSTCFGSCVPCWSSTAGGGIETTAGSSVLTARHVSNDRGSTKAAVEGTVTKEKKAPEADFPTVQTVLDGCDCTGKPRLEMKEGRRKECDFAVVEGVHPLVSVIRKLSFWLRLHLGSLGKRAVYRGSCERIHQRFAAEADVPGGCSSVTRVGAILSTLQSVVYMLPLRTFPSTKDLGVTGGLSSGQDRKRKLEVEDKRLTHQQQNKLIRHDDSASGYASGGQNVNDSLFDKGTQREMWIYRVILLVLEDFFRCSTLVRHESSRQDLSNKGEHLVKMLAELQDRFSSGQSGESLYTETQQMKHHWEQLSALDPKEQQTEVVAAGAYLLDCIRVRMGAVGMEDTFLQLLAKVRGKVLRQRMERKVQLRQQAVIRPQQFAERRRKRQKKKTVVRSVTMAKKKRQKMLPNC